MLSALLLLMLPGPQHTARAEHHMKRYIEPRQSSNDTVPLLVVNQCSETIYPGIVTQGGTGPADTGYEFVEK